MNSYKLEGFPNVKIRRNIWQYKDAHWYLNKDGHWLNKDHSPIAKEYLKELYICDDWELFKETQRITLYRYTFRTTDTTAQTNWTSRPWEKLSTDASILLKTETKVVEINN